MKVPADSSVLSMFTSMEAVNDLWWRLLFNLCSIRSSCPVVGVADVPDRVATSIVLDAAKCKRSDHALAVH